MNKLIRFINAVTLRILIKRCEPEVNEILTDFNYNEKELIKDSFIDAILNLTEQTKP